MNGNRPEPFDLQSSSSSAPVSHGHVTVEDVDEDDEGPDRQDSALLTDDPLDEVTGKAP